jgi:TonB family protein
MMLLVAVLFGEATEAGGWNSAPVISGRSHTVGPSAQRSGDDDEISLAFDKAPVPTHTVMMAFPDTSIDIGSDDKFRVMVTIDTSGAVVEAMVVRTSAFLERLAVEAAKQWEFTPAEMRGEPVKVRYLIPMWFEQENEK